VLGRRDHGGTDNAGQHRMHRLSAAEDERCKLRYFLEINPKIRPFVYFAQKATPLKSFDYQQPGEIIFGNGRISEVGSVVSRYGQRCLIVSGTKKGALADLYPIVGDLLEHLGLRWEHFDGVTPNPTVDLVSTGAKLAKRFQADVILGIGGGSSLDAAKAIAVEATHEGTSWDYLFFKRQPSSRTLPVVAVGTTAGSGSHATQVAVVTDTASRDKSALYSDYLVPRAAIIDPQLTLSVPSPVTAATGFDVFCHAFESTLNPRRNAVTELFAWEAVRRVINDLPTAVHRGASLAARSSLAWADTLAGMSICRAGVVLPHGIAMAVGGMFPSTAHGRALASVYRACLEFTFESSVSKCAALARLLDPNLEEARSSDAAALCPSLMQEFLGRIGLTCSLRDFGISTDDIPALAKQSMVLPDYTNNPKVPVLGDIVEIITASF
jgi:alcohol dehydrogenase class IV